MGGELNAKQHRVCFLRQSQTSNQKSSPRVFQAMETSDNAGGSRMIGSAVDPLPDGWPMGMKTPAEELAPTVTAGSLPALQG